MAIDKKQIPQPKTKPSDQQEAEAQQPQFIAINSFAVVLATDQPSRLQNAFQKRMGIIESLHR